MEVTTDRNEDSLVKFEHVWNDMEQRKCVQWIRKHLFKRVCLQFPDNYLPYSNNIRLSLSESLSTVTDGQNTQFFILADTSYGSCCVDEIGASHVEADSIIHFGDLCQSEVVRLPVLFVLPHLPIDLTRMIEKFTAAEIKVQSENKSVCIYLDIGYVHILEDLKEKNDALVSLLASKSFRIEAFPVKENEISDDICIFVGTDNKRFFNLSLIAKAAHWFIYDPIDNGFNETNPLTTQFIRRRYHSVELCKDAQHLGLLVATLSVKNYLGIVARLQDMAKKRGVKTQIISVGQINVPKLANFLEIDCFILIGCPFNDLYKSKEFYKPIVSTFEAEMALNPSWYMKYPDTYVTDFKQLLPDGRHCLQYDNGIDSELCNVSLVNGRTRNLCNEAENETNLSSLSTVNQTLGTNALPLISNSGMVFEDRSWKGLDAALGSAKPVAIQMGLRGIPIHYTYENKTVASTDSE